MKISLLFLLTLLPLLSFAQAPTDTVDIPDGHFKWMLLTPGFTGNGVIDTNGDGEIEYGEAEAATHLYLNPSVMGGYSTENDLPHTDNTQNNNPVEFGTIDDLTGIEAFTNLQYLNVSYNDLDSLNLSFNENLDTLRCSNNHLVNINIEGCTQLTYFWCNYNNLSTLDITQNSSLKRLSCYNNQIQDLNLEENLDLIFLSCGNNPIDSLNLQQNTNLNVIVSLNSNLNYLDIRNGNNENLSYLTVNGNPDLTCIFVDDKAYANNAANWTKDTTAHYVETKTECAALRVKTFPLQSLQIYPNPVKSKLYIKADRALHAVGLFNLQGKEVFYKTLHQPQTTLDMSEFTQGIYFLKLVSQDHILTRKIIKL